MGSKSPSVLVNVKDFVSGTLTRKCKMSPVLLQDMKEKEARNEENGPETFDIIFMAKNSLGLERVVNHLKDENNVRGGGFRYETYESIHGGHIENASLSLIKYLRKQPGMKYIEENAVWKLNGDR